MKKIVLVLVLLFACGAVWPADMGRVSNSEDAKENCCK